MKKNTYRLLILLCNPYLMNTLSAGSCFSKPARSISESSVFRSDSIKGFTQWPSYQVNSKVKPNLQMQRSLESIAQTCKSGKYSSCSYSFTRQTKQPSQVR